MILVRTMLLILLIKMKLFWSEGWQAYKERRLKINKSVNIIFHNLRPMDFGSRISESKDYMSVGLRENYNSNSISSKYSTPTQIVDELRKKYDTPTRRDKDMPTKSLLDRSQIHQDL